MNAHSTLTYNEPFCYPANGHDRQRGGRCWLRLYSFDDRNVAVVTELHSNDGPSVTNAIESIRELLLVLGGRHIPLTLIEHYDDRISYGRDRPIVLGIPKVRYSLVEFDPTGYASWSPIGSSDVDALAGRNVAEDLPPEAR